MPRCPRCKTFKDLDDFPRNRASKNGRASYCKPCHNEVTRLQKQKQHGSEKQFLLRLRYGVDEAQVAWMALQQGGKCAICREGPAEHVDHDHDSKTIRGLLCFNCNRALGYFHDDLDTLYRAADYREANRA